jgi:low affinity Fe/Cu permease
MDNKKRKFEHEQPSVISGSIVNQLGAHPPIHSLANDIHELHKKLDTLLEITRHLTQRVAGIEHYMRLHEEDCVYIS